MKDFKKSASFGKRKSFGARDSDRPTEMHKATCNGCHALCEVPFRPNGKKPVYCRDCFKSNESDSSSSFSTRRPNESVREENNSGDLKKQFSILNTKLDRLIAVIEDNTRFLSSTRE